MVSLQFRHWVFKPEIIPTIVFLLGFPLLLSLGFWQLHRADEKRQLLGQYSLRIRQSPVPIKGNEPDYTPVSVTGYYDNQHTLFLDNRFYNHQLGYEVISPFITSDRILLVNRGWIPRSSHFPSLPAITTIEGKKTIHGLVKKPEKGFTLSASPFSGQWPWVIEDIALVRIEHALAEPLYPVILLLSPNEPHGFIRHWEWVTAIPPQRHQAYAIQWFILAGILVIIYIKLTFQKIRHEK